MLNLGFRVFLHFFLFSHLKGKKKFFLPGKNSCNNELPSGHGVKHTVQGPHTARIRSRAVQYNHNIIINNNKFMFWALPKNHCKVNACISQLYIYLTL